MTLAHPIICRAAIAGASSLRGKDLAEAMEERNFPATDVRLLDDEVIRGAADNLRLASATALSLAETLLAS